MLVIVALQNVIAYSVNMADNIMLGAYSQEALSGADSGHLRRQGSLFEFRCGECIAGASAGGIGAEGDPGRVAYYDV